MSLTDINSIIAEYPDHEEVHADLKRAFCAGIRLAVEHYELPEPAEQSEPDYTADIEKLLADISSLKEL